MHKLAINLCIVFIKTMFITHKRTIIVWQTIIVLLTYYVGFSKKNGAGYGNEFVNGHLCVHSQWHNRHQFSKKGGNAYCKKFIYTDVKTDKFKRKN